MDFGTAPDGFLTRQMEILKKDRAIWESKIHPARCFQLARDLHWTGPKKWFQLARSFPSLTDPRGAVFFILISLKGPIWTALAPAGAVFFVLNRSTWRGLFHPYFPKGTLEWWNDGRMRCILKSRSEPEIFVQGCSRPMRGLDFGLSTNRKPPFWLS